MVGYVNSRGIRQRRRIAFRQAYSWRLSRQIGGFCFRDLLLNCPCWGSHLSPDSASIAPLRDPVPNPEIHCCIPTEDPFFLEVIMQTIDEFLILWRATNEARRKLQRRTKNWGRDVLNQWIWEPTPTQKGEGKRPGFLNGAVIQSAGIFKVAGFQILSFG